MKNIVFDFGGVIVDISRDKAVERFKEIGVSEADNILGVYKQTGIFLELEEGKLSKNDFYDAFRELTGTSVANEQIDFAWFGFMLPVLQERLDYLLELRKKYKVYLLSNTNPIIMSWARSAAFSKAKQPLDYYFDKLYLSYEMGVVKPNEEIFQLMQKDVNMIPEETLFVDDGPANIETAQKLGFKTYMPKEGEDYRYYFGYKD